MLRDALKELFRDDAQQRALIGLTDLRSLMVSSRSDDVDPGIPEGLSVVINYIVRDQTTNIFNQLKPKAMHLLTLKTRNQSLLPVLKLPFVKN